VLSCSSFFGRLGRHRRRSDDHWKELSEIDLLKGTNAQVGRLAALLGLLITATALTLRSGPIHDISVGQRQIGSTEWILLGFPALLGVSLYLGITGTLGAMRGPVTPAGSSQLDWKHRIELKPTAVGPPIAF
jgi:hypothetical protein